MGHGNPVKSGHFVISFSRLGKSWILIVGHGKSLKIILFCGKKSLRKQFLRE